MCEEKKRLVEWYEQMHAAQGKSITALKENVGTISQSEYKALRVVVEDARLEAEHARIELDAHVLQHGC